MLGPVMFDVEGTELTPEEITLLKHPATGGIILFTRNFCSLLQLQQLIRDIRKYREGILIAVDQEGGRVQRFRPGFTRLPAPRKFGELYDQNPQMAKLYAQTAGWMMAAELRQFDIDFSFAPVLDVDYAHNDCIGDRAFHTDPDRVAELAEYFIRGMQRAGMKACGKHFPGHGFVKADSHDELPIDTRSFSALKKKDVWPFAHLIKKNLLSAIMPAHILYSKVDKDPAGFSSFWLKQVLRESLQFKGVVFSDSLTMSGAEEMGSYDERAQKALEAGCDMILVCNNRLATWTMLEISTPFISKAQSTHLQTMRGHGGEGLLQLESDPAWQEGVSLLETL